MSEAGGFALWPEALSRHAHQVDLVTLGLAALLFVLTVPVFVLMAWFAIKYRAGSSADRSGGETRNVKLEVAWALLPLAAALVFFAMAGKLYVEAASPPANALPIAVVAKQWMWKAQHPGGQREIDALHVPVGTPVRLTMISQDVIHSFFVPALRLKKDVLPGRYTEMWFTADEPGRYPLRCAEFCGTSHSLMTGELVVMRPEDYQRWLDRSGTDPTLASQGERLFRDLGCSGCHGAGGTVRAPRLEGLFGRPVPLAGGGITTADAAYVRNSILRPNRQVAAGYDAIMPSYEGQIGEEEIIRLVAYIRSLADEPGATP